MTWLKKGEEFDLECASTGLSDAAYRTHSEGLSYAMARENDGVFLEREVKRFAESERATEAVQELLDAGFWTRLPGGRLKIVHHMNEQLSAAYLADKRKTNAARQQRKRETDNLIAQGHTRAEAEAIVKGRASREEPVTEDVTASVTRDITQVVTPEVTSEATRDPEQSRAELNRAEQAFNTSTSNLSVGSEIEETTTVPGDPWSTDHPGPVEPALYPTDPEGIRCRQKIEANNIGSVEALMKFQPKLSQVEADRIWAQAYPVGAVV